MESSVGCISCLELGQEGTERWRFLALDQDAPVRLDPRRQSLANYPLTGMEDCLKSKRELGMAAKDLPD